MTYNWEDTVDILRTNDTFQLSCIGKRELGWKRELCNTIVTSPL